METNLIGFAGCKQSGKNTVAKIWQSLDLFYNNKYGVWEYFIDNKNYNSFVKAALGHKVGLLPYSSWEQKSFAHKLKQILCILTGCTIEQLEDEDWKNSKLPECWKIWDIGEEDYLPTYREALQYIGTDLFKDKFHSSTWINGLFSEYKLEEKLPNTDKALDDYNPKYNYPNWLITDVRFQDEADSITKREGKLIKVLRFNVGDEVYYETGEDSINTEQSGIYKIVNILNDDICLVSNGTTELNIWFHELVPIIKGHKSETKVKDIQTDYTIYNCTTIEVLIEQVREIMIKEGVINEKK